jgi:nucleotide-binding universal stress UspA family protein
MKIMVGVDGSDGASAALRWAGELASATAAEVLAVHVVEPPARDIRPLGLPRAVLFEADWREALAAEVEGLWCGPLLQAGVDHRVLVVEGSAGPCLTDLATREHADLVVIGRTHVTGLADVIHHSTGAYVTQHAPCPMVVIPADRLAA